MRLVLKPLTVLLLLGTLGSCQENRAGGAGQPSATDAFAGTWSLASWEARTPEGQILRPFGERPAGQIMYDGRGNMMVQLMRTDRPRFASDDPLAGTASEMQAAFQGFFAYYGGYTVQAADSTVTHLLVGSSFPNWIGTDQARRFSFNGDTLLLSTPLVLAQGATALHTLRWVRQRHLASAEEVRRE